MTIRSKIDVQVCASHLVIPAWGRACGLDKFRCAALRPCIKWPRRTRRGRRGVTCIRCLASGLIP